MFDRGSEPRKLIKQVCGEFDVDLRSCSGRDKYGNWCVVLMKPRNKGDEHYIPDPLIDRLIELGLEPVKWQMVKPTKEMTIERTELQTLPDGRLDYSKRPKHIRSKTCGFWVNKETNSLVQDRSGIDWSKAERKEFEIAWMVRLAFAPKHVESEMAPDHLMKRINEVLASGEWREGISFGKKCESTLYKVGQRVWPKSNGKKMKQKYYFITSYRTCGHMGSFRLMREDGRMCSNANGLGVKGD